MNLVGESLAEFPRHRSTKRCHGEYQMFNARSSRRGIAAATIATLAQMGTRWSSTAFHKIEKQGEQQLPCWHISTCPKVRLREYTRECRHSRALVCTATPKLGRSEDSGIKQGDCFSRRHWTVPPRYSLAARCPGRSLNAVVAGRFIVLPV